MEKFSFALTLSTTLGSGEKNSVLLSEPIDKNIFMRGFMSNLFFVHPAIFVLIENFVVVVILLWRTVGGYTMFIRILMMIKA